MSEEEQSTQVEEACDADDDLELDEQSRFKGVFVGLDGWARGRGQIVDDKDVGEIMHQSQEENHDDQSEE